MPIRRCGRTVYGTGAFVSNYDKNGLSGNMVMTILFKRLRNSGWKILFTSSKEKRKSCNSVIWQYNLPKRNLLLQGIRISCHRVLLVFKSYATLWHTWPEEPPVMEGLCSLFYAAVCIRTFPSPCFQRHGQTFWMKQDYGYPDTAPHPAQTA